MQLVQKNSIKALIIATGFEKRIESGKPKPLLNVFGMPIVEYAIRKLKGHEIIVVYHDKEVEEFIKRKFPHVKLVYNSKPEKGNLWSLYLTKDFVKDDFILLTTNHIYGEKFFEIDRKKLTTVFVSMDCINADEATKVKVKGKKVVEIGELEEYEYFDTGFFFCKKEIFDYAEKCANKHKNGLADIIFELAKNRRVEYELVDEFWINIDSKEDLKKAEKLVEKSLIRKTDGIINRIINRKVSTKITKILTRYDFITPNLVTIVSFIIGFFSSALFFMRNLFLAGIMAQVCSIIDCSDGEIARVKNMESKFGAVFDSVLDRYVDFSIVLGMVFAYGFTGLSIIAFFLALSACILPSYVFHLTGLRSMVFGRDMRLFIIMIGGILAHFNKQFLIYTMLFLGIFMNMCVILVLYKFLESQKIKEEK